MDLCPRRAPRAAGEETRAATGRIDHRSTRGAGQGKSAPAGRTDLQTFRRTGGGQRCLLRRQGRGDRRLDRPQRRRQVDRLYPGDRLAACFRRQRDLQYREHHRLAFTRHRHTRHCTHLPARQIAAEHVGTGKRRPRRAPAQRARLRTQYRQCHAASGAQGRTGAAQRSGTRPHPCRPAASDARTSRQSRARPATHSGNCPRAVLRSVAAVARRTSRRPASSGEAGTQQSLARTARKRHEHPAGGTRHGVRHAADRSYRGDGIRRQDRGRHAGTNPAASRCDRSVSGWNRMNDQVNNAVNDTSGNPLLEVKQLCASYGKVQALYDIDLKLERGSIATVIGPNGAGKSTLLNAIMGVLPSQGGIHYRGQAIERTSLEQRVLAGVALVPERRELFSSMSVEDNLQLGGFRRVRLGHPQPLDQLATVFELFPRLRERRTQLSGTLSGGERQMLAIGRAMMAKPDLLMLDEPSLGLAPRIVKEILQIVSELRQTGLAVLLIEQNARAALQVADYGYVLELGQISMQGESEKLANDSQVIQAYLGFGKH